MQIMCAPGHFLCAEGVPDVRMTCAVELTAVKMVCFIACSNQRRSRAARERDIASC